jgi:hypothetical protein
MKIIKFMKVVALRLTKHTLGAGMHKPHKCAKLLLLLLRRFTTFDSSYFQTWMMQQR